MQSPLHALLTRSFAEIGIAWEQAMAELGDLFFPGPNNVKEVPQHGKARRTCKDHSQMQRVQAAQLQHYEEQEEYPRPLRDEQVLPLLQKAHRS